MKHINWQQYGFQNLLVWLFVYLVIGPFLSPIPYAPVIVHVLLSAVLFSAVYAVHRAEKGSRLSVILMAITLVLYWLHILGIVRYSGLLFHLIMSIYFAALIRSFFMVVYRARRVTSNVISAALCLYLIIGLFWATVYALLESLSPGSFSGELLKQSMSTGEHLHEFVYFSYITLTTLGYGDILPQTRGATALCQAEAIIGQFFIAVLVARLVGIEASQKPSNEASDG